MRTFWKKKLTAFDALICRMVASVTERKCEPKNGGDHYFLECCYSKHNEPGTVQALRGAIEGMAGKRLIGITDRPERESLIAKIKFYTSVDETFVPRVCPESGDNV